MHRTRSVRTGQAARVSTNSGIPQGVPTKANDDRKRVNRTAPVKGTTVFDGTGKTARGTRRTYTKRTSKSTGYPARQGYGGNNIYAVGASQLPCPNHTNLRVRQSQVCMKWERGKHTYFKVAYTAKEREENHEYSKLHRKKRS